MSGSLAAIGAHSRAAGLADPGVGPAGYGAQGGRKQQPAKPVPLRPPMGMPQQQPMQAQQAALMRVKQNPDEDGELSDPSARGSARRELLTCDCVMEAVVPSLRQVQKATGT